MRRLKGSSLLETIVAATLFLTVFYLSLGLLARLPARENEAEAIAAAEAAAEQAFRKYGNGCWPNGNYTEATGTVRLEIRLEPCSAFDGVQTLTITAASEGSHKRITIKYLVECRENRICRARRS